MFCITLVLEGGLLLCLVGGANALMKELGPLGRYYPDSGERVRVRVRERVREREKRCKKGKERKEVISINTKRGWDDQMNTIKTIL